MRLPAHPKYLPKQRHVGRFWDTNEMMEILSIYHGSTAQNYPHTWSYRTLIAVHRAQQISNALRKGYGPDWKCLSKEKDRNGAPTGRWIQEKGLSIKAEVLEYSHRGRLPLGALQLAAAQLREVEFKLWINSHVEQELKKRPRLLAAE
jgi:hypothetical protein